MTATIDLAPIATVARAMAQARWFARVDDWERKRARAHSAELLAIYERDAAETRTLRERAAATAGAAAVVRELSTVVDAGLEPTFTGAVRSLAATGHDDEELARVASGSAIEAAYRCALALINGVPEHRFCTTYARFVAGDWPLDFSEASTSVRTEKPQ
ncbi:MAG: hypothetical protein ACREM6_10005 [Vulcanimicrobiaceae bacterium]